MPKSNFGLSLAICTTSEEYGPGTMMEAEFAAPFVIASSVAAFSL